MNLTLNFGGSFFNKTGYLIVFLLNCLLQVIVDKVLQKPGKSNVLYLEKYHEACYRQTIKLNFFYFLYRFSGFSFVLNWLELFF